MRLFLINGVRVGVGVNLCWVRSGQVRSHWVRLDWVGSCL